jgi:hypothetical protein
MGMKLLKKLSKKKSSSKDTKAAISPAKSGETIDKHLSTPPPSKSFEDQNPATVTDAASKNDNEIAVIAEEPEQAPVKKEYPTYMSASSEGRPSMVTGYKSRRSAAVPTASDSAYSGPPRYDWVDVESAAAIRVQSVFRRNKTLKQLESEGKLTASMRNRQRSIKYKPGNNMVSEDVPGIFRFCGVGFLFGDAMGEDSDVLNEKDKSNSEVKKQMKMAEEEKKRKFRMRNKSSVKVEESIEVVDDV